LLPCKALWHSRTVALIVNVMWGESLRRPREGLGRVVDRVQAAARELPLQESPDDGAVDIYICISGSVWQHDEKGFRLGNWSDRGRRLQVMIYVPDELCEEAESIEYFRRTLDAVAESLAARIEHRRRPRGAFNGAVAEIRSIKPIPKTSHSQASVDA